MSESDALKVALQNLIAEKATDQDRLLVQGALLSGRIVHASNRGVGIAGDATGSIIITGDVRFELGIADEAFQRLRKDLFPKPQGIPPPFPELIFIGREDALEKVKSILAEGDLGSSQQTAIVRGVPGVGKTTLVSVLSRDPDIAKRYPDGVLWTSLERKPALLSLLANWGRALDQNDLLKVPNPEGAAELLREILGEKRMLLIVDDVWEADHGALFLSIRGRHCGLLVTTRLTIVAEALALESAEKQIFKLDVLEEEHALKLMSILAPDIVAQHFAECRDLINDLERLPLAIHVAARLLNVESKYGWGISDLVRDIRSGAALMEAEAPADRVEGGKIPTVRALLQKSTDILDETTRYRFAVLGVFAPKPATFDSEALKAVWQVDDPRPGIRELVERGLLEPAASNRFQMHALLVAHASSLLPPVGKS